MALNPRLRARLERQGEQERRLTIDQKDELARLLPDGQVLPDEVGANHSVVKAGGPVEAFVVVNDIDELKRVLEWAEIHSADYRFWGEGAFTLVRDRGLAGIIVKLGDGFREIAVNSSAGDGLEVSVGSAARFTELASFCEAEGISGAERLACAQGTLAGLLCAQAVPEGFSLQEIVEEVTILTRDMRELTIRGSSLRFEEGRLKIPRTAAVTKVLLKLEKRDGGETAAETDDAVGEGSDSNEQFRFACAFRSTTKITADELIYDVGLSGVRVGGARISSKNVCTIINEGEAKARDIAVLISLVRDRVKQETGIALLTTIDIVGERL